MNRNFNRTRKERGITAGAAGVRNAVWVLAVLLLLALLTTGCGKTGRTGQIGQTGQNAGETERGGKLKVVTTLFPYYDFTRQIAGDHVELSMVIPAGMDSHSFEPTPADIRMIQNADLLICNGGTMEHWVGQVLSSLDTENLAVITMMDYVDVVEEELVEGMEDGGEGHDHGSETDIQDSHNHSAGGMSETPGRAPHKDRKSVV